eukprot:Nk52_evm45s2657 gene=Nk52_evmTU45s2657
MDVGKGPTLSAVAEFDKEVGENTPRRDSNFSTTSSFDVEDLAVPSNTLSVCKTIKEEEDEEPLDAEAKKEKKLKTEYVAKDSDTLVYCVCKSPQDDNDDRPMVCCEFCENWFHFDCIGLDAEICDQMESYYCSQCEASNPSLKTVFKKGGRVLRRPECACAGCSQVAAVDSKYCSSLCGYRCVFGKLLYVMNVRGITSDKQPFAEENCVLSKCRAEKLKIEKMVKKVDKKIETLKAQGERGRESKKDMGSTKKKKDERAGTVQWDCISCGQPVNFKHAWKHVNKCYVKVETSMTSLNSCIKRKLRGIDDDVFCNYFEHSIGEYCQRLYILCPDHGEGKKKTKKDPNEICGYPFGKGSACQDLASECLNHFNWEKLKLASLLYDKIRLYEEYYSWEERETNELLSLKRRRNIYPHISHCTIEHS